MCTKNERPSLILKARKGDTPRPVVAYKAVVVGNKKGVHSGLNKYQWRKGWNKATGRLANYDKLLKMVGKREQVEGGAFHLSESYAQAAQWLDSACYSAAGAPVERINAIIQVLIRPEDLVAWQTNGEIAAKKVFVESLKPLTADPSLPAPVAVTSVVVP